MKLLTIAVYVILAGLGAIRIVVRSQRTFEFTAARDLPPNHRVFASDLQEPVTNWALAPSLPEKSQYCGRYLDRRVEAGKPVRRDYLKARPVVAAAPGTGTYAWLLSGEDKRWLQVVDVGWTVDLCAETCPVMDAPVLALDCANPSSGPCAEILQLTIAQKQALLAYPGKNKLKLIVSRADLGGTK